MQMRNSSCLLLSILFVPAGMNASVGQTSTTVKYYEAKTVTGGDAPRPYPWCELADFGGRSLWQCDQASAETFGFAGNVRSESGGGKDGGGMSGGGGMDGGGGGMGGGDGGGM
jgi:hypothetical protein